MSERLLDIKNRFKNARKALNLSQAELANVTGVDKTAISKVESENEPKRIPTLRMIVALEEKLGVNRQWIETGIGEMFLHKTSSPRLEAIPLRLADPEGYDATGDKIYELNDGSLMMEVPVVSQRAYAGYLRGYADPEFFEDLPTIPVMIDKRAFSTYMAFEVHGDSMVCLDNYELADKSIFPGRIAVGRLLDQSKWKYKLHTHNYDAWIIVHKTEGILIKSISKHDVENGIITIHSLNPQYKDEDLHLKDIEQIFSIVKIEQKKR